MMHAEIGTIKSKYLKKLSTLERMLDQTKNEKKELQMIIETQKQGFQMKMAQQDQKT